MAPGALHGKVGLVTGGGSGIGEAVARSFADAGVTVVVVDLDADTAGKVAADLPATPPLKPST